MKFLIAPVFLFFSLSPAAQEIRVGENCRDLLIKNIHNYKSSWVNLSSFKGKALIIDFFATWCTVCLEAFPALDSFQKLYGDRLQILLVSDEKEETVTRFFNSNRVAKKINIPYIAADKVLKKVFRHTALPHDVWIDATGKVQAITGGKEITEQNLLALMNNKQLDLSLKKDLIDFNVLGTQPLIFNNYDSNLNKMLCYSYFGSYQEGMKSAIIPSNKMDEQGFMKIRVTNISLLHIYKVAYRHIGDYFPDCRIIMDSLTSLRFSKERKKEDILFSYDLFIRTENLQYAYEYMLSDLNRFFNLVSTIEKRKVNCLILRRTSAVDKIGAKGEPYQVNFIPGETSFYNVPIRTIIQNCASAPYVIIDETGYTGKVDIMIPLDKSNVTLDKLRNFLKGYDVDLIEEEREMEVIVLKDRDN